MSEERSEPIKFKLDQPVEGTFLFDTPLSGESTGRDGEKFTWYMYKFKTPGGSEEVFFPSKGLQKTISELEGGLEGKKFVITKVLLKDENGNTKEDDRGQVLTTFNLDIVNGQKEDGSVSAEEAGFADLSGM